MTKPLYYCSDVSITVSVITTFFEVFRLFKFVNKIHCIENYLELHETNDIYENPINQGRIWNLFMSLREILRDMHGHMGTLWLRGAEGLICPKFYTQFFFFFSSRTFATGLPKFGRAVAPPAPLPRTPMLTCT